MVRVLTAFNAIVMLTTRWIFFDQEAQAVGQEAVLFRRDQVAGPERPCVACGVREYLLRPLGKPCTPSVRRS